MKIVYIRADSYVKVAMKKMEVIKTSNTIQLLLFTLVISIEKIQENFTEIMGTDKKGIKEKIFYITAIVNKVSTLAIYNPNYRDNVTLKNVKVNGDGHVCRAF